MSGCNRRRAGDAGFTLVEVLVALMLLSLVMVAVLPLIISMLRATTLTKSETQAKNLGQQRLEEMRNLRFHVDRQNGPFLDLLDLYYTNATSTGPVTVIPVNGGSLTGQYVASGGGTGGEPTAPFYRVTTGPLSGAPSYSQKIDTQFLAADGSVLPASRFQDLYNSQVVGSDQPPSMSVAVTVITSWTQSGVARSFRTYTRITEGRPQAPAIQSQARATAVDITSTAADGTTLELKGGVTSLAGSQSSGSSVSGQLSGAIATRTGYPAVFGQSVNFNLPLQTPTSPTSGAAQQGTDGTGCSWFGFGTNAVAPLTGLADVSGGLPKSPANATDTTPSSNVVTSSLVANGGNNLCGLLSYDNLYSGGGLARTDQVGVAMGGAPFVKVFDTSGNSSIISASGYVTSTPLTATPQVTRGGAAITMAKSVVLFPKSPDTDNSAGTGLVKAQVTSGSVDCVSGTSSAFGPVLGKYTVVLRWWGRGSSDTGFRWHAATWTYDSSINSAPVLVAGSDVWDPTNTDVTPNGEVKLSDLVQLGNTGNLPNVVTTGATSGLRGFPNGILTLSTSSTLANESGPGYSKIQVTLGQMTCVADDQR